MEIARNCLLDQNFGMCVSPEDQIQYYSSMLSNYYRPWTWCIDSEIRNFESAIDDQKDKFKITLDVQHFRPNEISVKVIDKEIIVEGKHEERQDNHGIISRQFKRRYVLPSDCLPELVSSTLSSDGLLTVTAGRKSIKSKETEIIVPIKMCGPTPKKEEAKYKARVHSESKKIDDIINNNQELKDAIASSKEESCSIKTGLNKASEMSTKQMLTEARNESDNLRRIASDIVQMDAGTALGKLENVIDQSKSKVSLDEMIGKVSEKNMMNMMETSNFKSMMKERVATEEISSFQSSTKSSMKVSDEQISEFVSEVISAELKEAAEIV